MHAEKRISIISNCLPCADSHSSPLTLPTPYSIYENDHDATVVSKLSPASLMPVEGGPLYSPPMEVEEFSRDSLPPSYSSIEAPPNSVRLPRPPQVARSKTTSSVSQHVRSPSSRERPELSIIIPNRSYFSSQPGDAARWSYPACGSSVVLPPGI